MSFLFRRNNSKNKSENVLESSTDDNLTTELKTLKREFQEIRRQEIVDKFVNRVKVLFDSIIKTESEKGNYYVERKNLTITNCNYDLITDSDKLKIVDYIKKEFSGYFVSVAVRNNSVDIIMKWESSDSDKDTFWEDSKAYESRTIADNYNKLPYLRDDLTNTESIEPPEEIVDNILEYLRSSTRRYGTVPRHYTYRFPKTASTLVENSNYRRTMNDVIGLLPSDFHSIKGQFQRTSKNAIVAFTLDFIIEV